MTMSKFFVILAVIYLAATVGAGTAALLTTLWAYNTDARIVSDTVTAAIINTAAAVAAMGFFGGFDMIFTIWQFMRNQEAEKAREAERAEERKTREEERKAQQAEREAMLATMRAEREQFMTQLQAQLQAERERSDARAAEMAARSDANIAAMLARNDALTARLMELTEVVIQRNNGNGAKEDVDSAP